MISRLDFKEKQIAFIMMNEGDTLNFLNDNIVVRDSERHIKLQLTCYLLFSLYIVGNITVTSGVLSRARKFGFSIIIASPNLRINTIINNGAEGNVLLRRIQYSYSDLDIGAMIISNKIKNQVAVLSNIRKKDEELKTVIQQLKVYSEEVLLPGLTCQEIMGREGISSKLYFAQLFKDHNWVARRPRVKFDEINCMLDMGYTMLFNFMDSLLSLFGFDNFVGVLHREFYQRRSLVCDLVEPFRPIIDNSVRKALNLGQVHEDDFYLNQLQYTLFGKNAVPYIKMFTNAILDRKEEIFCYVLQYYRAFVRRLPVEEYPVYEWRVSQ